MAIGISYKPIIGDPNVLIGMGRIIFLGHGNVLPTRVTLVSLPDFGRLLPAMFRIFRSDGLRSFVSISNAYVGTVLIEAIPILDVVSKAVIENFPSAVFRNPSVLVATQDMVTVTVGITRDRYLAVTRRSIAKEGDSIVASAT